MLAKTAISDNIVVEDIYLRSERYKDDEIGEQSDWIIIADIVVNNKSQEKAPLKLFCHIYERNQEKTHIHTIEGRMVAYEQGLSSISLSGEVPTVAKWSIWNPHLYHIEVEIRDCYDSALHHYEQVFGFRTIVRSKEGLLFNHHLLGVKEYNLIDRVEYMDDHTGMHNYIKHLRACGINTIITDHPYADPLFFELCDRYGMYIVYHCDREECQSAIKALRRHPSIILWSIENEGMEEGITVSMKKSIGVLDRARMCTEDYESMMYRVEAPILIQVDGQKSQLMIEGMDSGIREGNLTVSISKAVDGEIIDTDSMDISFDDQLQYQGYHPFLSWNGERKGNSSLFIQVKSAGAWGLFDDGQVIEAKEIVVGCEAFEMKSLENDGHCELEDGEEGLLVRGDDWMIALDKNDGSIAQISLSDKALLDGGIRVVGLPNEDMVVQRYEHETVGMLLVIQFYGKMKGIKAPVITYEFSNLGEVTVSLSGVAKVNVETIGLSLQVKDMNQLVRFYGVGPSKEGLMKKEGHLNMIHELGMTEASHDSYEMKEVRWLSIEDPQMSGIMVEQNQATLYDVAIEDRYIYIKEKEAIEKDTSFHFSCKGLLLGY